MAKGPSTLFHPTDKNFYSRYECFNFELFEKEGAHLLDPSIKAYHSWRKLASYNPPQSFNYPYNPFGFFKYIIDANEVTTIDDTLISSASKKQGSVFVVGNVYGAVHSAPYIAEDRLFVIIRQ